MNTRPVLLIHWRDACQQSGKLHPDDVAPPLDIVAVGILVKRTRGPNGYIQIAREWFYDGSLRATLTIPLKYIISEDVIHRIPQQPDNLQSK